MAVKFSIQQKPDGKSFIFKDLTDWDDPGMVPDTGDITKMSLEIEDPKGTEVKYEWTSHTEEEEISIEDLELSTSTFLDGVYKFQLFIETTSSPPDDELESDQIVVGFAAIVTQKVMRASLSYHPNEERKKREWILELQRLLSNLRYSAYTGNYNYYNENLEQLQKIL